MHQIRFPLELHPDLAGKAYSAPPDPIAVYEGPILRGGREYREGRGRQGGGKGNEKGEKEKRREEERRGEEGEGREGEDKRFAGPM